jgi:hypothetical protein
LGPAGLLSWPDHNGADRDAPTSSQSLKTALAKRVDRLWASSGNLDRFQGGGDWDSLGAASCEGVHPSNPFKK